MLSEGPPDGRVMLKQMTVSVVIISQGSLGSDDGTCRKNAKKDMFHFHSFGLLEESDGDNLLLGFQIAIAGSRSKDFFDRYGDLKRIRRLKFWPLDRLLAEKYKFAESDAHAFANFLNPPLDFVPERRPTAAQCLQHPWLSEAE
ncbi:hypothetical protein COCNU_09G005480 [Cocos nucifera]|uniref:non-specific serine/threonine protein kinase n=1 Tax=Cocos nucifera TaxID=13894 RepID=A0A8K0IK32_COCNU|nr:hypothetical protein COCNU_09G005480 [Cocos nucifera]